jgi:hypothetical protein
MVARAGRRPWHRSRGAAADRKNKNSKESPLYVYGFDYYARRSKPLMRKAFTIEEKIKIITISRGAIGVWTTPVVVMSEGMALSCHA